MNYRAGFTFIATAFLVILLSTPDSSQAQEIEVIVPINSNFGCGIDSDGTNMLLRFVRGTTEIRGYPPFPRILRNMRARIVTMRENRRAAVLNGERRKARRIRNRIQTRRALRQEVLACRNGEHQLPDEDTPDDNNPDENALRLNTGGSLVGAALTEDGISFSTEGINNLPGVRPDGELVTMVHSGSLPKVLHFTVLDGFLYLVFQDPVALSEDEEPCKFARFPVGKIHTGECIELGSEISSVLVDGNPGDVSKTDFVQGHAGDIYYKVYSDSDGSVLRKRSESGDKVNITNSNIEPFDFMIMSEGTIILSGRTTSNSSNWTRRIRPGDNLEIKTLVSGNNARSIREFPDGRAYLGIHDPTGVIAYNPDSDELDGLWISPDHENPEHPINAICASGTPPSHFCSSNGADILESHWTHDDRVYVLAGSGPFYNPMLYYPELEQVETIIPKAFKSCLVSSQLILAGLDENDRNVMTSYDIDAKTEKILIDPDEHDIEMYHVQCVADGSVLFEGLNFANNTQVTGSVDPEGQVKFHPIESKVQSLRTF